MVVRLSKKGIPFHTWRTCREIDKDGLFFVIEKQEFDTEVGLKLPPHLQTNSFHYMIYKKKKITDFGEMMEVVDHERISRGRDIKIKKIIG
jgi:hypothetical protein